MTFPGRAEITQALSPVADAIVTELGSRVDVYVIRSVAQKDKTFKKVPELVSHDVPVRIRVLTAEQAQDAFGKETNVTARALMSRAFSIEPGFVLQVIDGDFKDEWFSVATLMERPVSITNVLGLVTSEALV